jgi:threonine/homoserine/homoserine lactone efflux protein
MLLLLRMGVNQPLPQGLATVAGIATGLLVHCTLACGGLTALLLASPKAAQLLGCLGACYLLWIAWNLARSLWATANPAQQEPAPEPPLSFFGAFRLGLLTNLTNIKAMVFLASFLALSCTRNATPMHQLALVGIIVGQALFFWSLFVCLLKNPWLQPLYLKLQKPLNAVFCVLLVFLAFHVLWLNFGKTLFFPDP